MFGDDSIRQYLDSIKNNYWPAFSGRHNTIYIVENNSDLPVMLLKVQQHNWKSWFQGHVENDWKFMMTLLRVRALAKILGASASLLRSSKHFIMKVQTLLTA